ncbi:alpha/beta hydrolase [Oceanisphaera sp. IT1-181]|uniref:alpha/beta hydrolase n=1 Tax=Oceanisphaera sp. IT1-181 TaxID=3081199 RepID=UPI0029C9F0FF|nr:alpha/beta fold hydrolase [Oceanisphaera sp. IT1-181]
MKVYFAHGKESGPWGSKIARLAELATAQGYAVESVDYSGMDDPDQRVELLVSLLQKETGKVLLVGSSMGGYVALVTAQKLASEKPTSAKQASEPVTVAGVFLLAPALYIPGYQVQQYQPNAQPNSQRQYAPVAVVHGWSDDIIPAAHSIRFAEQHNCSLHLIPGDHRLNSSMHLVEPLFSQFMRLASESAKDA